MKINISDIADFPTDPTKRMIGQMMEEKNLSKKFLRNSGMFALFFVCGGRELFKGGDYSRAVLLRSIESIFVIFQMISCFRRF